MHGIVRPYECFQEPQGPDRVTRILHEILPLSLQNLVRDRYIGGWADNGVVIAGVGMALRHPRLLQQFLALGKSASTLQYGHESHQTVEIHRTGKEGAPLLVFMHGGAWFSGKPWMYRLMANTFVKQGFDLALVGYTVYSANESLVGLADHQCDDLQACLQFLTQNEQSPYCIKKGSSGKSRAPTIFLSCHSSGCHIVSMFLLRQALGHPTGGHGCLPVPISGFFGLSGVYDIQEHFFYESRRGVHEISGMKAANRGISEFNRHSPTFLAGLLTPEQAARFPPSMILHGVKDETVPFTNSLVYARTLENKGVIIHTAWLDGADHQDPILMTMLEEGSLVEKELERFKNLYVRPQQSKL